MSEYYTDTNNPSTGSSGSSSIMRAEFDLISAGFDKLPTLAGNGSKAVVVNAGATALTVTTGTLTLAGNFATSGSSSLTLTTTGSTNVTLPTSGTLASSSSKLSAFAATTSAELKTVISDETGSGALVFADTPTLVTPVLGAATATSINGLTITSSTGTVTLTNAKTLSVSNTLTLAGTDGKTLTVSNSLTLAGTDGTTITFPSSSATVAALNLEDQTLSGGVRVTSKSITAGNFTVDPGDRPLQYITNSGAFTITAPANDGSILLLITNDGTAGTITWSGFTVSSDVGDAFTTTNTHKFLVTIARINSVATYIVKALQ